MSSIVDRASSRDLTLTNREAKDFWRTAYDPHQVGNGPSKSRQRYGYPINSARQPCT
jgi:hypothetical protein